MVSLDGHFNTCAVCLSGRSCGVLQGIIRDNASQSGFLTEAGEVRCTLFKHGSEGEHDVTLNIEKRGQVMWLSRVEAESVKVAVDKWLHSDHGCA